MFDLSFLLIEWLMIDWLDRKILIFVAYEKKEIGKKTNISCFDIRLVCRVRTVCMDHRTLFFSWVFPCFSTETRNFAFVYVFQQWDKISDKHQWIDGKRKKIIYSSRNDNNNTYAAENKTIRLHDNYQKKIIDNHSRL